MENAQVKNASDAEQVNESKKKDKSNDQQDRADLLEVLATRAGRRFLWSFISKICRIHSQSYVQNSDMTTFNEGRRTVGLKLIDLINQADRHAYGRMAAESVYKGDASD